MTYELSDIIFVLKRHGTLCFFKLTERNNVISDNTTGLNRTLV